MKLFLKSLVFNAAFFLITAIFSLFGVFVLIFSDKLVWFYVRLWCRIISFLLRCIVGINYSVEHEEKEFKEPVIYAVRHESAWETIMLSVIIHEPAFVLKKELVFIPLFGLFLLKLKMIIVNRKSGSVALRKLIKQTKKHILENRNIIIFPEGTRVEPNRTKPIESGITALYNYLNIPIIPVTLNSGYFWPRRGFIKYPGTIKVKFLSAIEPHLKKNEFIEKLQSSLK